MPPFVNKYSPRRGVRFPKLGTSKQSMELGKPQGAEVSRFCSQSPGSRLRLRRRRGYLHPSKSRASVLGIMTKIEKIIFHFLFPSIFGVVSNIEVPQWHDWGQRAVGPAGPLPQVYTPKQGAIRTRQRFPRLRTLRPRERRAPLSQTWSARRCSPGCRRGELQAEKPFQSYILSDQLY